MMKKINLAFFPLVAIVSIFVASCTSVNPSKEQHQVVAPPDVSSAELNRIKSLAGKWSSTTSMFGKKDEQVFTEYAVTAGGSAVLETIFPDTPNEMVSVYYDDDQGKLAMTHYCMMRNRPHFTLAESSRDKIKLNVVKVEGLKSEDDPSMGTITLVFEDNNHLTSICEGRGKSAGDQAPMAMRFTRVK